LAKQLRVADAAVRADRWDRSRVKPADGVAYNWAGLAGLSGLFCRTLGIVGLGEVGALVASIARGFAMRVIYANRHPLPAHEEARLNVAYAPLPRLLGEADFVSLHASNLPENRGLFDAAAFAAMKRGAFFINTSRGRLVDEDALFAALTGGHIAGAGLDVHAQEPRAQPDRFAALQNVILTPHCAGGSRQGHIEELEDIFANCRAVLAGQAPRYQVHA
jgi:phosphoglycerate dehydrogenase-like enzyme